jgi:3-hydroxyisobutyrate dehydrogenase-like beta-hydroxyacid dehydrogenase
MAPLNLGFIGMGLMGEPMTLRLLDAGFNVFVWNRNSDKTKAAADAGANVCDSMADLVKQSDVLLMCVSDTNAVDEIVFGDQGIAAYAHSEQALIDFSSIAPDATRDFAQRLYDCCGCRWIDAPVSGGVAGAEQGSLAIMAGGDATLIEQLQPVFAPLSQGVTHMGPVGSGQVTKVCNQMIVSCNVLVMAEVLALAEQAGVNAKQIPTALKGGFADSIPLQLTGSRMAAKDFDEIKWHVKTLLKDLTLADDLHQQVGSETPMATLAKQLMQQHADSGFMEKDPATLITRYLSMSGMDNQP